MSFIGLVRGGRRCGTIQPNWQGNELPGEGDVVSFGAASANSRVILNQTQSIGRLLVELGSPRSRLTLDGRGKLIVTGVDSSPGKPVSLSVANGVLEVGSALQVEIQGTRVSIYSGGQWNLLGGKFQATRPNLKLGFSQTGVLRILANYWEPNLALDVSTSRSRGKGARIIDLAAPPDMAQGVTFSKFKEHDGDPLIIKGFERGDYLRFYADPKRSADPGKELILDQVQFDGWPRNGEAEIKVSDGFWYLLPVGESMPQVVRPGQYPPQKNPTVRLDDLKIQTIFKATDQFPRNSGGDIVKLRDGRWLLAFSQWLGGTSDADASRVVGVVSSDMGRTWGSPFVIAAPNGPCKVIRMPSFLRLRGDTLALLVRMHENQTHKWASMLTCVDESKVEQGPSAWSVPRRITPPPPGAHVLLSNWVLRLKSGRILMPLASPWPWDRNDAKATNIRSWCLLSDDDGRTWHRSTSMLDGPSRGLMEPCVVQLKDGRLLMLMRTQTHRQHQSISEDDGDNWTTATEVTHLVSPEAPAAVRRDPRTGWLMVVWNHNSNLGRHGRNRVPLTVAFSRDEGRTWFGFIDIETDRQGAFSYPSINFLDGCAHVTYYDSRRVGKVKRVSLKMCRFVVNVLEP